MNRQGSRGNQRRAAPSRAAALSFDWLLSGATPSRFSNEIRDRTHLHLHGRAIGHYDPLLRTGDLERIVSQNAAGLQERLSLVRGDTHYDAEQGPSGALRQLHDAFAKGFTISLTGIASTWQPVARLCTAVAAQLNCQVSATAFLTPPSEQGFPRHFDSYDTFILQIAGEKTWRLYAPPIALPMEQDWYRLETDDAATPQAVVTLAAGDLFYLPRGVPHEASATTESSLHVSLVVLPYTWRDLLVDLIDEAAEGDVDLRRSVALTGPTGRRRALPARVEQLATLLAPASLAAALERGRSRIVDRLVPLVGAPLPQHPTYPATTAVRPDDHLRRVDGAFGSIRLRGERAVLAFPGDALDAPLAAAAALRFMARGPSPFPMNAVPGPLTAASNCLLATRLVRAGFLQIERRRRRKAPHERRA